MSNPTTRTPPLSSDPRPLQLYEVEPNQLNWQVQRNVERFPDDFIFRLSKDEAADLKCQISTSSWGGDRYLPYAFMEQGIAMLSGVLRSEVDVLNVAMFGMTAMPKDTRVNDACSVEGVMAA